MNIMSLFGGSMSQDISLDRQTDNRQMTDGQNRLLNPASHMHARSMYNYIPSLKVCTYMVHNCPASLSHAPCMNGGGREEEWGGPDNQL